MVQGHPFWTTLACGSNKTYEDKCNTCDVEFRPNTISSIRRINFLEPMRKLDVLKGVENKWKGSHCRIYSSIINAYAAGS